MAKRLSYVYIDRCVGCQSCMFACARRQGEGGLVGSCIGVRSAGGMEKGFVIVVCRACKNPPCAHVCPTNALTPRSGGGVHLRHELCIGCGNCVKACPMGAVFWDPAQSKPQICVYCGACVPYCPYDILVLEEIEETADVER